MLILSPAARNNCDSHGPPMWLLRWLPQTAALPVARRRRWPVPRGGDDEEHSGGDGRNSAVHHFPSSPEREHGWVQPPGSAPTWFWWRKMGAVPPNRTHLVLVEKGKTHTNGSGLRFAHRFLTDPAQVPHIV